MPSNVNFKVTPQLPAQIIGARGIVATKSGLTWTISYGYPASTVAVLYLTTGVSIGAQAFATNGRKVGEAPGLGTGVPVYFNIDSTWRVYSTDSPVTV